MRFRTRGGAVVDGGGRLLDANGKAIAGVYCCGAAAQGGGESLTTNGAFGVLTGKAVTEEAVRARLKATGDHDFPWYLPQPKEMGIILLDSRNIPKL